ncbi:MAG: hypothetical protein JRJ59_01185 [Deltaproteobacteria bacterium]|nr:hypothetical protein [Deltaproteobacteria bacterium]
MFKKFHVNTREARPRFVAPAKSGIIDWSSGCIGCLACVKKLCPHQAYDQRSLDPVSLQDLLDEVCADCFRCVQSCPQRLIHKTLNPEYTALGDDYWTPEIISATWAQAATGKIPVSGAGYGGPFAGSGFDAMWTDMSEIVRPTRDGIHGREYISTSIQLGRRNLSLDFDDQGRLLSPSPPFVELPLPILLSLPPGLDFGPSVVRAVAQAAAQLDTLFLAPPQICSQMSAEPELAKALIPLRGQLPEEPVSGLVWLKGRAADPAGVEALFKAQPGAIAALSLELDADSPARTARLVEAGAGVILLKADDHGRDKEGRFIKDAVRAVHLELVSRTVRDQVTLLGSGGIAMAEHVAKAIICGLDGVVVDWPLLLALECRRCGQCQPEACPALIREIEPGWGGQRIMNLVGAWRDQLLEVLGAMGLREVRRLRGEVGRAMFFEDLEAEIFGPLFGSREVQ